MSQSDTIHYCSDYWEVHVHVWSEYPELCSYTCTCNYAFLYDVRLDRERTRVVLERSRQSYRVRAKTVLSNNDYFVVLLSSQHVTAAQRPIKREADATHVWLNMHESLLCVCLLQYK